MISALIKAVNQFDDPAIRKVVWMVFGMSILVFILLWTVVGYLVTSTVLVSIGPLEAVIDLLGGVATLLLTWFLFPAVVGVVMGFLLDDVVRAVEARHYTDLGPAQDQPVMPMLLLSLKFLGVLVLLNLGALFFLIPPFTPLFPFVFYAVNGYLLSREYFELVAHRRLGAEEARGLRKSNQFRLFVFGVGIAFLLTVPVVNLVAPVIAAAAMTHLFEAWRRARA